VGMRVVYLPALVSGLLGTGFTGPDGKEVSGLRVMR